MSVILSFAGPAAGMVYYDGGTDNTTEPGGAYADSGWDWTGAWGNGSGIAISSKHFITAKHFGTSSTFVLGGTTYNYDSHVDHPTSDLRVVTIQESFTDWAELYTSTDESSKEAVFYGRGYTRGTEVTVPEGVHGWQWSSTGSGNMRWGTNYITYTDSGFIGAEFNAGGGTNEAALANWDSGGGMFINDGGTWKLAGVNYAVSGPFDDDADHSSYFSASIFDKGDLYELTDGSDPDPDNWIWTFYTDIGTDIPGSSYGTRISSYTGWINSQIPEPGTLLLISAGAGLILLKRRKRFA